MSQDDIDALRVNWNSISAMEIGTLTKQDLDRLDSVISELKELIEKHRFSYNMYASVETRAISFVDEIMSQG